MKKFVLRPMGDKDEDLLELKNNDIPTFEVAALGCNKTANAHLKNFLHASGIETFHFYEFFLARPIGRSDNLDNSTKVCFPFIRRVLDKYVFIPYDSARITTVKDRPNSWDITLALKIKGAAHENGDKYIQELNKLHHRLIDPKHLILCNKVKNDWEQGRPCSQNAGDDYAVRKYEFEEIKNEIFKNARKKAEVDLGMIDDFTALPWYAANIPVISIALPIATPTVLYGYMWLTFACSSSKNGIKSNWELSLDEDTWKSVGDFWTGNESRSRAKWEKLHGGTANQTTEDLAKIMAGIGRYIYAPVLALTFNSIWERRLKDSKECREELFEEIYNHYHSIQSGSIKSVENDMKCDMIENGLASLWKNRKKAWPCLWRVSRKEEIDKIVNKLLFAKYLLASPGMIDKIRSVIESARLFKRPDNHDSLPAALVYGEAGSGKDTMAKLLALFSDDYFNSEVITVNAGAIKPDEVAGPILLGVDIRMSKKDIRTVDGIFMRAVIEGGKDSGDVFILDELNSLDPALQTILLRIIENGEVQPLFSTKAQQVRHLVIGIVNEDPEDVGRELEMSQLQSAKAMFGGILGAFIHEGLRKTRRLRPDLMYRLKRGAYIRMPALRERREDIPIIFLKNCRDEYEKMGDNLEKEAEDLQIELRAAEKLMEPQYLWPGNMRDLQAVAKIATSKLFSRCHDQRNKINEKALEVSLADVEGALRDHFGNLDSHVTQ